MKLINARVEIREVSAKWKAQYCHQGKWSTTLNGDTQRIYDKLAQLNVETATPAQVEKIIGNNSWAGDQSCDECGEKVKAVIQLGDEPDYESHTAEVCADCLRKALALMSPVEKSGG